MPILRLPEKRWKGRRAPRVKEEKVKAGAPPKTPANAQTEANGHCVLSKHVQISHY